MKPKNLTFTQILFGLACFGAGIGITLLFLRSPAPANEPTAVNIAQTATPAQPVHLEQAAAPTPTAVPPTHTPTARPNTPPASALVAENGRLAPVANASLCETHDDQTYHTLWDAERGCHYDHEHGQPEPEWLTELGGLTRFTEGHYFGWPWETPNENLYKHPGYNGMGQDVADFGCRPNLNGGGVWRWYGVVHGMANEMGQQARYHSFFMVAELCNDSGAAGLIATGGHADFGQLVSPYKAGEGAIVGNEIFAKAPTPYHDETPPYIGTARNERSAETWNSVCRSQSRPFTDCHAFIGFAFRILDPRGRWHAELVNGEPFFEVYENGRSAIRQSYQVEVFIPAELTGDDGRVNFAGYTDLQGNISQTCTTAAADCVPITIIDAQPGSYAVNLAKYPDAFGVDVFRPIDPITYYNGNLCQTLNLGCDWIGPMN